MRISALLVAVSLLGASNAPYRTALPGYRFEFPRDHFSHPEYQTEWWYYTGNLRSANGHRFGFELTFFRHGVDRRPATTVWDVQDAWLAHFALSDIDGKRFFHTERLNRAGQGLAGSDASQRRVWNGNWQVRIEPAVHTLTAISEDGEISLELRPEKAPVIHGTNGVSQKAEGAGRASHYFSYTRMAAAGTVTVQGQPFSVVGSAWMDHEFFTHQLEADQVGWDWFSLQFDDHTELMLFRLRHQDGSIDPYSAGTYVDAQGQSRHLSRNEFAVVPGTTWTSPATHGSYPIEWTNSVPSLGLQTSLRTDLPNQELSQYWEGAVQVSGVKQGHPVKGVGYLEMTGYAGPVRFGE